MRLTKWRIEKGFTQRQLADELGCSQTSVSLMERAVDPQIPERSLMIRIFRLTHGDVTPSDFYDLPALDQMALPIDDTMTPAPLFDGATQ